MLKFNVERKPLWVLGTHFEFDNTELKLYSKEEREKVSFLINPVTAAQFLEIREKHLTVKELDEEKIDEKLIKLIDGLGGNKVLDEREYENEVIDRVIGDWKGVGDLNGVTLTLTKENKIEVCDLAPRMGTAFVRISKSLGVAFDIYDVEKREGSEKNLETSQDGQKEELAK